MLMVHTRSNQLPSERQVDATSGGQQRGGRCVASLSLAHHWVHSPARRLMLAVACIARINATNRWSSGVLGILMPRIRQPAALPSAAAAALQDGTVLEHTQNTRRTILL